jgi:hypothetical protein
VKTEYGVFTLDCKHKHSKDEKISLLVKQFPSPRGRGVRGEGRQEIKLKVEDVLFKRDQFEVRGEGFVLHMEDAPTVGQIIKVKVQVECLT